MSSKLVICGSIAIDRIMSFKGKYQDLIKPDKLHVFSLSVLIDEVKELPGGTGANIAYNLALLGEEPVLLGAVGKDADNYIKRLELAGVDTVNIFFSKDSTATFTVLNDSMDNQVGGFYPGAMADSGSLKVSKFAGEKAIITISAHDPIAMRRQVQECKEHGLRLFYDASQQVSNIAGEDIKAGIEAAEIIIANDYEMAVLCKKSGFASDELKNKVPIVITTHGKDGSVIEGKSVKSPIKIEAAKPVKVLDPTGAGDAFRAGFLFGYGRDWDLEKSGKLGATVASFVVEEYGGQVQYNIDTIRNRYKENYNEEIIL
jgi:adenosine kinase